MLPPPLITVPFLATFLLYSWQHRRIDRERRGFKVAAGRMIVATIGAIGALGDPRYRCHPGRVWRLSWGVVRISVASFTGAYCLLRCLAPRATG